VDEVNALNVFPVPDGDTGSNMLATIQAAIAAAEEVPATSRDVAKIAAALSLGALMGARGNSGVILSQLLRGMAAALEDVEEVRGRELAAAFEAGRDAAFSAVAQPVEGTILTVAADVARAASKKAKTDDTLEGVLAAAAKEAAASVKRTPELLAILRKAGVVDAGGKGLEVLLQGALASVRGEDVPLVDASPVDIALPLLDALEEEGFGYETVFVVMPNAGDKLDVAAIRTHLNEIGESVLVAGDERAVKIHIHNERPDQVIAYGLTLGALSRIGVENLDRQATEVRDRVSNSTNGVAPPEAVPGSHGSKAEAWTDLRVGPQVVAVAPGEGLAQIFESLGVAAVVRGGQGANPSAGELAEAIIGTGAAEVIVLPNNPNVRMAAKLAEQLCPDQVVEVVPTRNAAEGVAAMLALDADAPFKDVARDMSKAAKGVQTLQATVAVRDARMGRHRVHKGEYIVLSASDGLVASDHDRTNALLAAAAKLKPGFELLTVYRGQGITADEATELRTALLAKLDGVEIELVDGGQPHYDFLISAE
jgi:DAK2 domain fusion protein YloV